MTKYLQPNKGHEEEEDDLNKAPKQKSNVPMYDFFNMQEFAMLLNNTYDNADEKMIKPTWINDQNAWNFLISLEKIPDLKGIVASISHNSSDWHKWYQK